MQHGMDNLAQNAEQWQVLFNIKKNLIHWSWVIVEKRTVAQPLKNFYHFAEPPRCITESTNPATDLYTQPDECGPR
jgi:hypothetical protein